MTFPSNLPILLDGQPVEKITAFLFPKGGNENPKTLLANADKSFQGSIVLGMGFTFDDSSTEASSIEEMERLIEQNPKNQERIFPYIGGSEVNSSPTHAHHRYVINFGEMSEAEARQWPDLMAIVEEKVKPARMKQNREIRARYWWRFGETTPALFRAIATCDRVLVIPRTSKTFAFTFLPVGYVYSENLIIFAFSEPERALSIIHSRAHEIWVRFFSSTLEDRQGYRPSDCFETFPFPANWQTSPTLEAIGSTYYTYRADLMIHNDEGLTDTYNRFHDPAETDPDIYHLRDLHSQMDSAVLTAYGWSDIAGGERSRTPCGFALDYLDIEPEDLPPEVQARIDSGDLFFATAAEATSFDNLIRSSASKRTKKLPWRYRWPESIHDEVLARLLDLNQERYEEEVKAGLHSKKKKSTKKKAKKTTEKKEKNSTDQLDLLK